MASASSSSSSPLRLAILECDTPQPQARAVYGSYTGVFKALLGAAARQLDPPRDLADLVDVRAYDVVNELHTYPALDDVDAVLLTGSRHTAFDDDPWIKNLVAFTRAALDSGRVRVVGICFGHQIVGRALDAPVRRGDCWEVAVTEVDLTTKGREIFEVDKLRIHQMHRDVVTEYPPDAISLGSNSSCDIQAMYSPRRYLTVQGHPEFNNEVISEILFNRHTVGTFSDELYEDGMRRASVPHDGVKIGKAILNFIRED
ncbi:hypothetical protein HIM_02984 [Hirsutella minnesotensis 3608]|nr:hypothetical protein HIM_02984 [Hirsutella minnesotensis 3608]